MNASADEPPTSPSSHTLRLFVIRMLAVAVAAGFWASVLPFVELSAWKLAALPAALLGALWTVVASGCISKKSVALLIVAAVLSAVTGDLTRATVDMYAKLTTTADQSNETATRSFLMAKIAEHKSRMANSEQDKPAEPSMEDSKTSSSPPAKPRITWLNSADIAAKLYVKNLRQHAAGLAISVVISTLVALQAARMVAKKKLAMKDGRAERADNVGNSF